MPFMALVMPSRASATKRLQPCVETVGETSGASGTLIGISSRSDGASLLGMPPPVGRRRQMPFLCTLNGRAAARTQANCTPHQSSLTRDPGT